jgi:hypothetical protein
LCLSQRLLCEGKKNSKNVAAFRSHLFIAIRQLSDLNHCNLMVDSSRACSI